MERVDGKGVAVASLPTDHPAITQVLLSNNMITLTKTLTECPVTWTLDVLNGAGAAITAYSSQISLATTTTEVTVTFSNYGSVDKVAWATVKVGLKADGTYFNQATLADMVLFSYQPHQCKAVLINFVTATPVVTL